jgi:transcriptional regulator with XRE-family HTH domain
MPFAIRQGGNEISQKVKMSDSFGSKIKALRIAKRLTLEEVAEKVDSTKAYVWQLENKVPARPSGKMLLELADVLGVSPDYLIDDSALDPSVSHLENALLRSVKGRGLTSEELEQLLKIADTFGKDHS